jgi:hypothetical protein
MSSSAKEILENLERRLLQQESEFAQKRSALEQSLKSLTEILDRTGWDYSALGSKAGELEQILQKQQEECRKTEKKLNSVISYKKRVQKVKGAIEGLKKEYKIWQEFERPALEGDIEVARQFLEEQGRLEEPSEKSETRKVSEEATALAKSLEQRKHAVKKEEQVLSKNLEDKKKEIQAAEERLQSLSLVMEQKEKERKARYQAEEQVLCQNLENKQLELSEAGKRIEGLGAALEDKKQEIIEAEEKLKEELKARMARETADAEKGIQELRARYQAEEAAMAQNIRNKEQALRDKFMAWAQAQKERVEKELEALKGSGAQAVPGLPQKEINFPLKGEKVQPEKKIATVTTLPIKPQPIKPAMPPRQNTDSQGAQRVFLADQQIEVKLKGIIEMGLLYDLTESEIGILAKHGNEAMRPGNTLPGVMFQLPDSGPVGGRAEVKDIRPNTDEGYDYKILLTIATPDLAESQRKDLAKFVEKSRLQNFKGRFLKVEHDF